MAVPNNTYRIGQTVNEASGERIVDSAWSPIYGWLNLTNLGGVYSGGGGSRDISALDFGGSYLGYAASQFTGDALASEVAGSGRFASGGLEVTANGYRLRNTTGGSYDFAGAPNTPPASTTSTNQSAKGLIAQTMDQFGLGGLTERYWQRYLSGTPLEVLFGIEIFNEPEFKARYPAYETLRSAGQAITVAEYRAMENAYTQVARQVGLPATFYDQPDDFTKMISNRVSPAEFADRLQPYIQAAAQTAADPTNAQFLAQMQTLYGVTPTLGELTAYLLDPNRALSAIQQQTSAAQIASAGVRSQFGQLTRAQAENLAAMGVDSTRAIDTFTELASSRDLFSPLPGTREDAIDRDTQLAAAFSGDAGAREQIGRRARTRVAAFEGGGGFAGGQGGNSGLGRASR